jgi:hypothetical protein
MSFRRLTGVEIVGAPVALTEIHLCSQSRFCGQMNQRLYNTAYPSVLLGQVGSEAILLVFTRLFPKLTNIQPRIS